MTSTLDARCAISVCIRMGGGGEGERERDTLVYISHRTLSLSLSLSLSESQQDLDYLCLLNTNSSLSSAAEPPGYEIMPLCFLRSQEVHVHRIADIVNELLFICVKLMEE